MSEQQILRVIEYVADNNNVVSTLVFIDAAQIFHEVSHKEIVVNMVHLRFPANIVQLLDSDLMFVSLKVGPSMSTYCTTKAREENVLASLLYAIYRADIPSCGRCRRRTNN